MAGTIITFYSYKGGVGRSFALVNTATILAAWGFRVLCVDWDLEAPGLDAYFEPYLDGPPRRGLAEAFTAFAAGEPVDPGEFITPVTLPEVRGRVDLLPAGHPDDLVRLVQRLDWAAMYRDDDLGATLEEWRARWMADYHFVLIDSRTGITDIGGVCTAQMPDVLVAMFTAGEQSVRGVQDVIRRAEKARDNLPYDRARLLVLPVPSRFDGREEYEEAERWRQRFVEAFAPVIQNWVHQRTAVSSVLAHVTIPYIAYWSFGERIAALKETDPTPNDICYPLHTLAALLAHRLDRTQVLGESRESYISAAAREGLRETSRAAGPTGPIDVFVNQVPGSPEGRVFISALERRGLRVAGSTESPDPDVLSRSDHMVLLIETVATARQVRDAELFLRQLLDERSDRSLLPVLLPGASPRNLPSSVLHLERRELNAPSDLAAEADRLALDHEYRVLKRRYHETLADPELTPEQRQSAIFTSSMRLGVLAEERRDYKAAASSYADALDVIGSRDDRPALFIKGRVQVARGRSLRLLGRNVEAVQQLSSAIWAFEDLINQEGQDPQARLGLANAYFETGHTQRAMGEFGHATQSFDLAEHWLIDSPENSDLLRWLLRGRADVRQLRGDYAGALTDLLRAVELFGRATLESSAEFSQAGGTHTELAELYIIMGNQLNAANSFEAAADEFARALALAQGRDDADRNRRLAVLARTRQGNALSSLDAPRAEASFTAAINLLEEAHDRTPASLTLLGQVYAARGESRLDRGDPAAAVADFHHAVDLLRDSAGSDPARTGLLAATLGRLGMVARISGDFSLARRCLTESLSVEQRRALNAEDPAGSLGLAVAYSRLGVFEATQGYLDEARTLLQAALATYRRIPGAADSVEEITALLAQIDEIQNQEPPE